MRIYIKDNKENSYCDLRSEKLKVIQAASFTYLTSIISGTSCYSGKTERPLKNIGKEITTPPFETHFLSLLLTFLFKITAFHWQELSLDRSPNKQRDKLNDDHQQRNNNIKTKKKKITKKTNKPKSELITAQVFDDDIFRLYPSNRVPHNTK